MVAEASLPALSDLEDLSPQLTFDFANNHFDPTTGTISVDVAVINKTTSKTSVSGPLLMQVTALHSDFGAVEAANSDNGQRGVGAVWDLTSLLSEEVLPPGAVSARRRLLFHVSDPKIPDSFRPVLVDVGAKMFGKQVPNK